MRAGPEGPGTAANVARGTATRVIIVRRNRHLTNTVWASRLSRAKTGQAETPVPPEGSGRLFRKINRGHHQSRNRPAADRHARLYLGNCREEAHLDFARGHGARAVARVG